MKLVPVLLALLLPALSMPHAGSRGQAASDPWLARPVDDRTFKTYLDFMTYDQRLPFEPQVAAARDEQGIRVERLSFQSTPGVRVPAVLYSSAGGGPGPTAAVILLHGGGAEGKDSPHNKSMAALLSRAGWSVLTIDMLYFGERATDLLTTFSELEKHDRLYNQPSGYLAWTIQTVKDIRRAFDFLTAQRRVDPTRIGLLGASRGAIVASIAAGAEPRFASVVLFYGGHVDALERGHLAAACPANYIGRISPRPLLMINGVQDSDMIKESAVEPLFRLARKPKQILWTDGGHFFTTEEHRAAMLQWLRATLR